MTKLLSETFTETNRLPVDLQNEVEKLVKKIRTLSISPQTLKNAYVHAEMGDPKPLMALKAMDGVLWLSIPAAAKFLGLSKNVIREAIAEGHIAILDGVSQTRVFTPDLIKFSFLKCKYCKSIPRVGNQQEIQKLFGEILEREKEKCRKTW